MQDQRTLLQQLNERIHIFDIFGYVEIFLGMHYYRYCINNFDFQLSMHPKKWLKSHFCKNWLNFRISINREVFILRSQLSSHLNQNHRFSIQIFDIQLYVPLNMAEKPLLQKLAEFQDLNKSCSVHPTKSVKLSFEPESSISNPKF